MRFDVLIVGAGPSGCVAATVLARAGARVCIVDRSSFPRPKLCGDTVNPGALAILRRLGLAADLEQRGLPLDGMLVSGNGVAIRARYPGELHGMALSRQELDGSLLASAIAAGAEFRERVVARLPVVCGTAEDAAVVGVACTTPGGRACEITAPVTIAADGRRSAIAFALGQARHPASPRRWAVGMYASGVSGLTSVGEMHIRRGHYIGVAPLPGGLANVCLVQPADGGFRSPRAALDDALRGEPMLRDRFAGAELAGKPLVLGPLAVDAVRSAPRRGLLLAGDAAGFIDPMTGDGMRFAFRGGELAAFAALDALQQGWSGVHAALDAARCREFGAKWRFNRVLRALVGSPAGVAAATLGSRLAPGVVRALVRHASDCDLAVAADSPAA